MKWLDEKIEKLPKNNGIYKFMCMFLGKKRLSYKEMYLLVMNLNKNKLDEDEAKKAALYEIVNLYKFNNNTYPNFEKYDR